MGEDLVATAAGTDRAALLLEGSPGQVIVRDSVVTNGNGTALYSLIPDAELRNVTAYGNGTGGIGVRSFSFAGAADLDLVNVIARGTGSDLFPDANPGASATMRPSYSNYRPANSLPGSEGSVTPGSGNQSTDPALANPAAGDFHQTAASPTINAGLTGPGLGPLDFDGQPRVLGSAPDIGADERALLPLVTTEAASVRGLRAATLTGSVTPNGLPTTFRFEYGTSTAYGRSTPSGDAGAANAAGAVSSEATGLRAGTTYHYRLVGENEAGAATGEDRTFTTAQLRVRILSRRARERGGKVALRLRCLGAPGASCAGRLTLSRRVRRGRRRVIQKLGSTPYRLAGGRTAKKRIRLKPRARTALEASTGLSATARATVRGGSLRSTRRKVRLLPPLRR